MLISSTAKSNDTDGAEVIDDDEDMEEMVLI